MLRSPAQKLTAANFHDVSPLSYEANEPGLRKTSAGSGREETGRAF